MAKRKGTDNTMAKRKETDDTMAKRKRTDDTMSKRKRTKEQTTIDKTLHRKSKDRTKEKGVIRGHKEKDRQPNDTFSFVHWVVCPSSLYGL
jgi:hypothetical protein